MTVEDIQKLILDVEFNVDPMYGNTGRSISELKAALIKVLDHLIEKES